MTHHNSLPFSPQLLLLSSLLFFFLVHTANASNTSIIINHNCLQTRCGNVTITYPFWVPNEASRSYCGYQGFQITCNGTTPTFSTSTNNYTVKAIDTASRTLSLIDSDVIGSRCPKARHNVSLENNSSLHLADSNTYLLFLFNCSSYKGTYIPETNYRLTCLGNAWNSSYVFNNSIPNDFKGLNGACTGGAIRSPVLPGSLSNGSGLLPNIFGDAMNKGFELNWKPSELANCKSCEESGGNCGYNNNTGSGLVFQCFCKDGIHYSSNCDGSDKKSNKKSKILKIGIGSVVGGVCFCLILALVIFVCVRHKKSKVHTPSLSTLFHSVSSYPSSISKDAESHGESYYKTPIFSYKELEEATGGFDTELGDGGFGVVFKGKLKDGRVVAVKRLYERNCRRVRQFRNEVEILNRLRHRNLVTLYGCTSTQEKQDLVLVYEYIPNGTVADHLHGSLASKHALTWPIRMSIAIETADALSYLHAHQPQVIHRDVKTSNILLENNYTVKVADFGLSRLFPMDVTHVSTAPQGTPGYVDPEYHQCYQLTDKSDVYSFGVVLVELISSKPAVDRSRQRSEINLSNMATDKIPKGRVGDLVDPLLGFDEDPLVRRMVEQVAEVAFRCLQQQKDARPSMDEVREMLKGIACPGDRRSPASEKHKSDGVCLLKSTLQDSPKSDWASIYTTPNASA